MMYKIHNWSHYQSYKDRRPPWIRFHREMLDDFKFHRMSVEARAMLPMLWLLACEDKDPTSGNLPPIDEVSFRLRYSEQMVKKVFKELEDSAFIECNGVVTNQLPIRNQPVTTETETEAETKKEYMFDEFYSIYPRKEAKGKAEPAYKKAIKEGAIHEEIIRGLEAYNARIKKEGTERQYIALPASWLSARRWEDKYEAEKPKVSNNRQSYDRKAELFG